MAGYPPEPGRAAGRPRARDPENGTGSRGGRYSGDGSASRDGRYPGSGPGARDARYPRGERGQGGDRYPSGDSGSRGRHDPRGGRERAPSGYRGERYSRDGNSRDGYSREGRSRDGYSREGRSRDGYSREGRSRDGYSREGRSRDGYSRDGYSRDGYSRDGYSREGRSREGRSREGRSREGRSRDGYSRDGRSRGDGDGYDAYFRDGYSRDGRSHDDGDGDGDGYEAYFRDGSSRDRHGGGRHLAREYDGGGHRARTATRERPVERSGRPRQDPTGGAEGNERLTGMTGAVLLMLFAAEGFTILAIHQLLTLHFFLGMLLVGPVILKASSTSYRFFRYYTGSPEYRRKGPPAPLLRLLGPFVLLLSLSVVGTGVMLAIVGPSGAGLWLFLHKASFVLWFGAMTIHVLAYVWRLPRLVGGDLRSRWGERAYEVLGGRRARWLLLTAALLTGLLLALSTTGAAQPWVAIYG